MDATADSARWAGRGGLGTGRGRDWSMQILPTPKANSSSRLHHLLVAVSRLFFS